MAIILTRVDDRLIHGQVTVGWAARLKPDLVLVISDVIACSLWQEELCLAALPGSLCGRVVRLSEAVDVINSHVDTPDRIFILIESLADLRRIFDEGAKIATVNVGGLHAVRGKREVRDYLFLDQSDIECIKTLHQRGIEFDFRDVPDRITGDVLATL